ncbi:hypothetical protein [Falsiroseomonas sp. E2-1-a20]|uniref:P-loop NTPase n=1 Tax=Falsiroseomonas sp. E2-1-a20 TaxID=3239300 RepID=UPI003F3DAD26
MADGLAEFVLAGRGSPYLILNEGSRFPALELGFEHLSELPDASLPAPGFAGLGAFKGNQQAKLYLQGSQLEGQPEEWAVLRHVAIERPAELELLTAVEEGSRLNLLTGAAGDGKTTMLLRLGMRLRELRWRVFLVRRLPRRTPFPAMPDFGTSGVRTCVIIDNADQAEGFHQLENDLAAQPALSVVLGARSHRWQRRSSEFERLREIHLPRLSEMEMAPLADAIVRHGAAQPAAASDVVQARIAASVSGEYPHLLAAMLAATRGKSFDACIESMIEDFHQAGDDWALKLVAGFSWLDELSGGHAGRISHHILRATLRYNFKRLEGREPDAGFIAKAITRISSEVVPLHAEGATKSAGSEYDVRHPDIARLVLRRVYGWNQEGQPANLSLLCEDLGLAAQDEVDMDVAEGHSKRSNNWRTRASSQGLRLLDSRHQDRKRICREFGRALLRSIVDRLGFYPEERYLATGLLRAWARAERHHPTAGEPFRYDGARYLDALYEEALDRQPDAAKATRFQWVQELWHIRDNVEADRRTSVQDETAANDEAVPYSYRWLARQVWEDGSRGSIRFVSPWIREEVSVGNIGSAADPSRYTARWIARAAWKDGVQDEQFLTTWMRLEVEKGEIGKGADPPEYSARWIARAAWKDGVRAQEFLTTWMRLEVEKGEIGKGADPPEYSARWIARAAWMDGVRDEQFLTTWMRLEVEKGDIGKGADPPEYSARWIARAAWKDGVQAQEFLTTWMRLEVEKGEIGKGADPPEYSARWIARAAWKDGVQDEQFLTAWMRLEVEKGDIGEGADPPEYSARWIARAAWKDGVQDEQFLTAWMRLEVEKGDIGKGADPPEYSARWIARAAWTKGLLTGTLVAAWMRLEVEKGDIGEGADPPEYSARWIARAAWTKGLRSGPFIATWMRLEVEKGDIGDFDAPAPHTARGIGRECWIRALESNDLSVPIRLIRLELEREAGASSSASGRWSPTQLQAELWSRVKGSVSLVRYWIVAQLGSGNLGEQHAPEPFTAWWLAANAPASARSEFEMLIETGPPSADAEGDQRSDAVA